MRRSTRHIISSPPVVNLTPMIDMVFILLIFFVVTSSFVKEAGIEVTRPSAETAVRQERASILVAVTKTGEIWIDKRLTDIRSVGGQLRQLHAENPEGAVVILADRNSQTGLVIEVLDQARLAGVANVAIAASVTEAQ